MSSNRVINHFPRKTPREWRIKWHTACLHYQPAAGGFFITARVMTDERTNRHIPYDIVKGEPANSNIFMNVFS